ncbi:hypothetical protein COLO4_37930 [Corchorus olitorius]|uniref:Uncharacterized protein n=1 Tax=Corchorus olitorius TaxID=93759 RepID=A0A1R3FXW4_9ROSI|nr:hypothetical protein COLO4_37930 [Corchorus olitorius]
MEAALIACNNCMPIFTNSGLAKDGSGMTEPVQAKAMDSRQDLEVNRRSWTLLLRWKPAIVN